MADDLFDNAAIDDDGVLRDQYGRYLLPPPNLAYLADSPKPGNRAWTRATTFAKTISDTYTLSMWGQRMVAKGLTLRPDLYALVAATPLEDKEKLNQLTEQAKEAAGAKVRASLGTALHTFSEQLDRGEQPTIPDPWDRDLAAYVAVKDSLGLKVRPEWIERIVVCEHYGVAGTFDRITELTQDFPTSSLTTPPLRAGELVIDDLKTGRDLSYGWGEIGVQLSIYAHADAIWNGATRQYEEMPNVRKDLAIVTHVPVGEGTATIYLVDIELGWQAAKLCNDVRQWRKVRSLATPITRITAPDPEHAAPVELSWSDRIKVASSTGELSAIWQDANARGEWTPELTRQGKARQRELTTA